MEKKETNMSDIARKQAAKLMQSEKTKAFGMKMATDPKFRMGVSAGSAGALGVALGLFDDEKDTALSLIGKGVAMAAIEAATEEMTIMGGQAYLKKYGVPNFVGGKIAETLNVPQKMQPLAQAGIKEASKRLIPGVNKGKLAATGIGAVGGLLWSAANNKDETVTETGTNMLVGSGLSLMGKELFEHWGTGKTKPQGGFAKQLQQMGGTGDLAKDMKDLVDNPQKFLANAQSANANHLKGPLDMNKLLKQLEGTPMGKLTDDLPKHLKEILDGDVGKHLKPLLAEQGVDWDNFRLTANEKAQAFQEAVAENKKHQQAEDKKVTVAKEQVKEVKSSIADPDAHHKAEMGKANKIHKTLKIGGIAAAAAIGVGSVLDLGNDLRKEKETERMKRKQEEQLRQKQRRENKTMEQNSYNYVDFGMIVGELFDDRIGHYKMGNSKFQ